MVPLSPAFHPPMIYGIQVSPVDPFRFDFIMDTGDEEIKGDALRQESLKLIKYFLASLTIPEEDLWVNLSPYEEGRIASESLGQTEMGRDLLAQDYMLKQISSSLTYPEDHLGKTFWKRVYQKAYELYGSTEVPASTFNKIWIVPDKAVVHEQGYMAFVSERHLKVMLEEDYLSMEHNVNRKDLGLDQRKIEDTQGIASLTSDIAREVLIPEIEREINEGRNFANLRQIYNAMILAEWYKQALRESILGQAYANKNKVQGVDLDDPAAIDQIYDQYLEAFKKGVFNLIKVEKDQHTNKNIPRKYFSGGMSSPMRKVVTREPLVEKPKAVNSESGKSVVKIGAGVGEKGGQEGTTSGVVITLDEMKSKLKEALDQLKSLEQHVQGVDPDSRSTEEILDEIRSYRDIVDILKKVSASYSTIASRGLPTSFYHSLPKSVDISPREMRESMYTNSAYFQVYYNKALEYSAAGSAIKVEKARKIIIDFLDYKIDEYLFVPRDIQAGFKDQPNQQDAYILKLLDSLKFVTRQAPFDEDGRVLELEYFQLLKEFVAGSQKNSVNKSLVEALTVLLARVPQEVIEQAQKYQSVENITEINSNITQKEKNAVDQILSKIFEAKSLDEEDVDMINEHIAKLNSRKRTEVFGDALSFLLEMAVKPKVYEEENLETDEFKWAGTISRQAGPDVVIKTYMQFDKNIADGWSIDKGRVDPTKSMNQYMDEFVGREIKNYEELREVTLSPEQKNDFKLRLWSAVRFASVTSRTDIHDLKAFIDTIQRQGAYDFMDNKLTAASAIKITVKDGEKEFQASLESGMLTFPPNEAILAVPQYKGSVYKSVVHLFNVMQKAMEENDAYRAQGFFNTIYFSTKKGETLRNFIMRFEQTNPLPQEEWENQLAFEIEDLEKSVAASGSVTGVVINDGQVTIADVVLPVKDALNMFNALVMQSQSNNENSISFRLDPLEGNEAEWAKAILNALKKEAGLTSLLEERKAPIFDQFDAMYPQKVMRINEENPDQEKLERARAWLLNVQESLQQAVSSTIVSTSARKQIEVILPEIEKLLWKPEQASETDDTRTTSFNRYSTMMKRWVNDLSQANTEDELLKVISQAKEEGLEIRTIGRGSHEFLIRAPRRKTGYQYFSGPLELRVKFSEDGSIEQLNIHARDHLGSNTMTVKAGPKSMDVVVYNDMNAVQRLLNNPTAQYDLPLVMLPQNYSRLNISPGYGNRWDMLSSGFNESVDREDPHYVEFKNGELTFHNMAQEIAIKAGALGKEGLPVEANPYVMSNRKIKDLGDNLKTPTISFPDVIGFNVETDRIIVYTEKGIFIMRAGPSLEGTPDGEAGKVTVRTPESYILVSVNEKYQGDIHYLDVPVAQYQDRAIALFEKVVEEAGLNGENEMLHKILQDEIAQIEDPAMKGVFENLFEELKNEIHYVKEYQKVGLPSGQEEDAVPSFVESSVKDRILNYLVQIPAYTTAALAMFETVRKGVESEATDEKIQSALNQEIEKIQDPKMKMFFQGFDRLRNEIKRVKDYDGDVSVSYVPSSVERIIRSYFMPVAPAPSAAVKEVDPAESEKAEQFLRTISQTLNRNNRGLEAMRDPALRREPLTLNRISDLIDEAIVELSKGAPSASMSGDRPENIIDSKISEELQGIKAKVLDAQRVGGIDLGATSSALQIKRDGNGMPLPLSQQPVQIQNIESLAPFIINIVPFNPAGLLSQIEAGSTEPALMAASSS